MDELTVETFSPHVGSSFSLSGDLGDLELVLSEAVSRGTTEPGAPGARAQFSLSFRGPAAPLLPQRIYRLHHHALGTLDIFLVPIAAGADGVVYEAAFA